MSAELKPCPCPFCGCIGTTFIDESLFGIVCTGCPATMDELYPSRTEAIAAWNTRALLAQGD